MKKFMLTAAVAAATLALASCGDEVSLPRGKASSNLEAAFQDYLMFIDREQHKVQSIMVVKKGRVVIEKWMNGGSPDQAHVLHSVSKTFTSMAAGMAISEGLLSLDDKVISFFPDQLPDTVSDNLAAMTVRDLLTMSCGHSTECDVRRSPTGDWVTGFLAWPVEHKPGTYFWYNSMGTYMVSAIIQKVTGKKVVEYLKPRLFDPLHIDTPTWEESPQGINCGGWGLYLKTEDLAKMGQLLLNQGKWQGRQLIPAAWIAAASAKHVESRPAGWTAEACAKNNMTPANNPWMQGYGYQIWLNTPGGYRADGARGQYILVFPEKDAVIAVTADEGRLEDELEGIWDHLYDSL